MILHPPFKIGSRLLPSLEVGGAWISLEHVGYSNSGRDVFRWYIDLADGTEYSAADLRSGCQGCTTQEAFGTLLAFLDAYAEAIAWKERTGRDSENADIFPPGMRQWARENADELGMLRLEIEESGAVLMEE